MPRLIPKLLLLVALVAAFAASSIPAFGGSKVCLCINTNCFGGSCPGSGGCQFDKKTSQCVTTGCRGICSLI